jgi:hypothetical protein
LVYPEKNDPHIDTHFLKGVSIVGATPAYKSTDPNVFAAI